MQIDKAPVSSRPIQLLANKAPSGPTPGGEPPGDGFAGRFQAGLSRGLHNSRTAFLVSSAAGATSAVALSLARNTFEGPGLTAIAAIGLSPILAIPVAAGVGAVMGLATGDSSEDLKTSAAIGVGSGILIGCLLTGLIR